MRYFGLHLNALRAFEAAARLLSFSRAAEELNVSHSTISHHVKGLEQALGVELFLRQNRRVVLTSAGETLFPVLESAFTEISRSLAMLTENREKEPLKVTVTPSFARFSAQPFERGFATTIGNALKYFGYSFNSVDEKELADAEKLLLDAKPHLFAISSDYQPPMRNGDAWMTMCWTGDGKQMNVDMPEIAYVLGTEGGELWSDYYAIPKGAPHMDAAYALIDFLLNPEVNAKEVLAHGYPSADARTNALLPKELLEDPILYPAADLLNALEFGAAATLTDPNRAELLARFKSA